MERQDLVEFIFISDQLCCRILSELLVMNLRINKINIVINLVLLIKKIVVDIYFVCLFFLMDVGVIFRSR